MSDDSTHKIIVGLDFGTTTCKAAYYAPRLLEASSGLLPPSLLTPSEAEIYPVEFSHEGHTEPTKLAWHEGEHRFFYGSELNLKVDRGSIPPGDVVELFKLSLDHSPQTWALRERQEAQRKKMPYKNGEPLSSIDLIAQFLRWFKDRVLGIIKHQLDRRRYNVLALADSTTWVLTLPANWEEASDDLRRAAREAGLGNIELVTETEAAAAAMFGSSQESFQDLAQEPILVADAGGGTHNVITYIVKSNGTMEEGLAGTGGLKGSYWLVEDFQDHLTKLWRYKLNNFLADQGQDPANPVIFQKLVDSCSNQFETQKKRFDGFSEDEEERKMVVTLLGLRNCMVSTDSNTVVLPKSVCEVMFAKIIDPIIAAIKQQIRDFNALHSPKMIRRVFFFGGLSKSPHVRKTISKRFFDEEVIGYPVVVIMPLASLSEVVVAKGAVLKSLRGDIITRRFRRRNFGIVEDIPLVCFPDHRRRSLEAVKEFEDNELRVRNRMVSIFRYREEYNEQYVRVHRGWSSIPLAGPMQIRVTLVSSPQELEQYADILDPTNEVTSAGYLEFDLNEEERSQFPTSENTSTGERYYFFQYEVRFTIEYLRRHFEVVIPRGGVFPKNWRPASMNGKDADARLGPDPIKKGVPILRQTDQKDGEDLKHIFEFQDRRFEESRAWKARESNGCLSTALDYPRPSKFRQTELGNLNTPQPSTPQMQIANEPTQHQPAFSSSVRKRNKFPSCELCVRRRRKCQRPSVTNTCRDCVEAGATCKTVSRAQSKREAAEKP